MRAAEVHEAVHRVGPDRFMDLVIERLTEELVTFEYLAARLPPRAGFMFNGPVKGVIEWMPLLTDEAMMLKVVSYCPGNPTRFGSPSVLGNISLYDIETGHLRAMVDGALLTAIRTGAASAIATRILAKQDSKTLGLVGAGFQAVTQLHALSRVCDLELALVHDVNPDAASSLQSRTPPFGVEIRPSSLEQLETESDIVVTSTSVEVGCGPVLKGSDLRDHVHINAVGTDLPGKSEIPVEILRTSLICPNFLPQALREGECQHLDPEQIGPELSEITREPGRVIAWRDKRTVFDSTGFALEDYAAMMVLLDSASTLGLGTPMEFEYHPANPLDSYGFADALNPVSFRHPMSAGSKTRA